MHGIREQEDEDDDENDIESGQCKRMSLHDDLSVWYIISRSLEGFLE